MRGLTNGYEMGILKVAPEANFEVRSLTSLSYDRSIASSKRVFHRVRSAAPSFKFTYLIFT
jgi:hypothetical protein